LDKTIATFTPKQSPSAKQPPTPANSISTEQQSNKKKATKPSLNTLKPQSLTSKETSSKPSKKQKTNNQAQLTQSQKASSKKQQCGYREYSIEKRDEKEAVNRKVYYEKITLNDEEWDGDKVKIIDSVVIEVGKVVRIYGVEEERVMIGLSMPSNGKKFNVYTFNKESGAFETYPLDDLTEVVVCTRIDEEVVEVEELEDMWWKRVQKSVEVKQEKNKKEPQRRKPVAPPQQLPTATNQLLNKLLEQVMDLIARVIALEKELARQALHYEETNRENIKMIVNNTLEIVKASRDMYKSKCKQQLM
jgi:hypothetical protein